jgi:hypothetical protein
MVGLSLAVVTMFIFGSHVSMAIVSMSIFLIISVCSGVGAFNIDEPVDKYITIYSLNDQLGTSGNFILGSGTVNSDIVYVGLLKHDGITYEQIIIKCKGSIYLIEDATLTETGYIKWSEGKYTGDNRYAIQNELEIHVPKGTIIKNFNVNGQ